MSRRAPSAFGKKGGTSATAGKSSAVYDFTFPDGTKGAKRSFRVLTPTARVVIYQHAGRWYAAGIVPPVDDGWWSTRTLIPAVRHDSNQHA